MKGGTQQGGGAFVVLGAGLQRACLYNCIRTSGTQQGRGAFVALVTDLQCACLYNCMKTSGTQQGCSAFAGVHRALPKENHAHYVQHQHSMATS